MNIDTVIKKFDVIIQECLDNSSALGYFPILYKEITIEIQSKIGNNYFISDKNVNDFTVEFAKKYFNAYNNYKNKAKVPKCWMYAFNMKQQKLTVLQHLLFAINAHINYDLCYTTAEMFPNNSVFDFQHDFNKINIIIQNKLNEFQKKLNKVNSLLKVVDFVGGMNDERIMMFSIRHARSSAWKKALRLAKLDTYGKEVRLKKLDQRVTVISYKFIYNIFKFKFISKIFSKFEKHSPNYYMTMLLSE